MGRGGSSVVYLAMDLHLYKNWAVKELRLAEGSEGTLALHAWEREADLMKRLEHPALPGIVDILEEDGFLYIVMDYIDGKTLDRVLAERRQLPEKEVIEIGIRLCEVLQYLHSRIPPIIYRDMKPSNIMYCPDGRIKLIDFGIAREYKKSRTSDTVILGTDGYAAPEQHGSGQTDVRSDIYSLGVTLRELAEGRRNVEKDRELPVSTGFRKILDRCTAYLPEKRYPDAESLKRDLLQIEERAVRERWKRYRRRSFLISAAAIPVILGICLFLHVRELQRKREESYVEKLYYTAGLTEEEELQNCLYAVSIKPDDLRAYRQYLEICEEKGSFSETECEQLLAVWNQNRERFSAEERLLVEGEIGRIIFYYYTGGDNSFRTRAAKAEPFFRENVPEYQDYEQICRFCLTYVFNTENVREPEQQEYRELPGLIRKCVDDTQMMKGEDAAYRRLLLFREAAGILNAERQGLAWSGVPEEEVLQILAEMEKETGEMKITRKRVLECRDVFLKDLEEYRVNLRRAYENASKHSESLHKQEERRLE